ncbi:MAG: hypothetical protein ACLFTQ_01385 [Candidatus Aenigmatarchaeota archaeon]
MLKEIKEYEEVKFSCAGSDTQEKRESLVKEIAERSGLSRGEAKEYYDFIITDRNYKPLFNSPPEKNGCLLLGYEEEDFEELFYEEDGLLTKSMKKLMPQPLKKKFDELRTFAEARVGYVLTPEAGERIIEKDSGGGWPVGPEDDRKKIEEYLSIGLLDAGINRFGQFTVKTSEKAENLLQNS